MVAFLDLFVCLSWKWFWLTDGCGMQYTKALRLFKEDPKWTPLKRGGETDENPYRKDYLQTTSGGSA